MVQLKLCSINRKYALKEYQIREGVMETMILNTQFKLALSVHKHLPALDSGINPVRSRWGIVISKRYNKLRKHEIKRAIMDQMMRISGPMSCNVLILLGRAVYSESFDLREPHPPYGKLTEGRTVGPPMSLIILAGLSMSFLGSLKVGGPGGA